MYLGRIEITESGGGRRRTRLFLFGRLEELSLLVSFLDAVSLRAMGLPEGMATEECRRFLQAMVRKGVETRS